jgi:hypothetical protein
LTVIGSPKGWAATSDRLVVNIGDYQKDETITEPANDNADEGDILLTGVPALPSGTGYVRINDPGAAKTLSDLLFYGAAGNSLTLFSDPISAEVIDIVERTTLLGTITEDGTLQNVGNFFGVLGTQIRVQSDLDTPEPSTWVMMLLGFAGLGFAGFRSRRARRAALA